MLDERRKDLSGYRLERAKELIGDAKSLFAKGSWKSSNNRAYYSIFHALRAVLALEGVEFKKHSGNIQHFLKEYVKTGKFSVESSEIIMSASRIRNASDYDDFYIASKSEAEDQIEAAEKFYIEVKKYLDDNN